jgi:DNA-binding HxlR family transcriptional regulator
MITTKMLNNDLVVMEERGLIKKAGYTYNRAGDPEQRYELTEAGN